MTMPPGSAFHYLQVTVFIELNEKYNVRKLFIIGWFAGYTIVLVIH